MTLHLGLSSHAHSRSAQQKQDIKEARRILKERVRNDWDYPPLPAYRRKAPRPTPSSDPVEETESKVAGFRFHHTAESDQVATSAADLEEQPVDWREREYSSASTDEETEGSSAAAVRSPSTKDEVGDWRFEGPDSVGTQISDRDKERKRKREAALHEEISWNHGLAHWVSRRNLWSGAQTSEEIRAREARQASSTLGESGSGTGSPGSTPRTSTSTMTSASASAPASTSSGADLVRDSTTTTITTTPSTTPSTTPDLAPAGSPAPDSAKPSPTSQASAPEAPSTPLLIPIAPPILVNHPVRRRISASIYPEIYSKIVVQSRTPSVPINLQTLMHALVQGWKDDGEWPPKAGPVEKSIGRKKGKDGEGALKHGVRAMGRVLRITGGGDSGVVAEGT